MLVVQKICEYLTLPDLVKVCAVIPKWQFLFKFPRYVNSMSSYISKFDWYDHRLYEMFTSELISNAYTTLPSAILYYQNNIKLVQNCTVLHTDEKINFSLEPSFANSLEDLNLVSSFYKACNKILVGTHLRERFNLSEKHQITELYCVDTISRNLFYKNLHVVIHVVLSFERNCLTIQYLLSTLKPCQTLLMVFIKDDNLSNWGNFDQYIRHLFCDSEDGLPTNSRQTVSWRIWFLDNDFTKLADMLEWAFYESVKKFDLYK